MKLLAAFALVVIPAGAESFLYMLLPERTRLLEDQRVDLVLEARNAPGVRNLKVTANGADITSIFRGPQAADLDCDSTPDSVYRADLVGFKAGWVRVESSVESDVGTLREIKDIIVQPFTLPGKPKNIIMLIGDGLTESIRDAGRLVARSVESRPGVSGLREGFYDRLLEMDQMPVSAMVINHGSDKVIPDSANSATALATGNKTFDGALSVFADGTDCVWARGANAANLWAALDNPRVETYFEYLRRRFGYRVGLVTTSAITDATPAAHASHMGERDAAFEVARQYLDNAILGGRPGVDVILGGGREAFDPDVRGDGRDLVAEFKAAGYRLVQNAGELRGVGTADGKVLGLFKRLSGIKTHSSGIRPSSASHMDVAYDKLGLQRPGSEPLPNFAGWDDQPFLDLMTQKALEVLGGADGSRPFALMVEGASIDKQSHSNHAAGTLWDVIEFDKAVGVARAWAKARKQDDTLMVVTADHGQSLMILGVNEVPDADYFDRASTFSVSMKSPVGEHTSKVYKDVNLNVRAGLPYGRAGKGDGPPADNYGDIYNTLGFPDYMDTDGDGYPENRATGNKGRMRVAVGFRTGSHVGISLPLSAEGPGAFLFTGVMDQTDIPLKIGAVLGGDTTEADLLIRKLSANPQYPKTPGRE